MSTIQKYAKLPDIDAAPEIYETPELIHDPVAKFEFRPDPSSPGGSPASSNYHDLDDEDDTTGIDRHRLDPDEARTHFDTTNRLRSKRAAYRSSSTRRRPNDSERDDQADYSDEEEETLERKLARLRREVAEAKEEFNKANAANEDGSELGLEDNAKSLDGLGSALDSIGIAGAASRLAKRLSAASRLPHASTNREPSERLQQSSQNPTYTMTYAPTYDQDHALAKAADLESRLTLIENVLGLDTAPLPTQNQASATAILPKLDALDKQISIISSSPSSLDEIDRRVRKLIQDTKKLTEAREDANSELNTLMIKQRHGIMSLRPRENQTRVSDNETPRLETIEDPEQITKINALYGALATIDSLSPLLPFVLDRLRSLRLVHADAANAHQSLTSLETRQEAMAEEIKSWREGLERVEGVMKRGEQRMDGNIKLVESLVKELEDRLRMQR